MSTSHDSQSAPIAPHSRQGYSSGGFFICTHYRCTNDTFNKYWQQFKHPLYAKVAIDTPTTL